MDRTTARTAGIVGLLCLVYVASLAVVGVSGDFPLNDDWAWAATARELARTGVYRPSDWGAMSLLTHVLYAAPFCAVTACSFDDLRLSTMLAAILLGIATCVLVRLATKDRMIIAAAGAVVLLNPISYSLSFTFMTEILFTALMVIGSACYVHALRRDSLALAVAGTAVAIAATLTRQLGLCLPIAYFAATLFRMVQTRRWRWRSLAAAAPIAAGVLALSALRLWLTVHHRLPASYDLKTNGVSEALNFSAVALVLMSHSLPVIVVYLGLLCFPILLLLRFSIPPTLRLPTVALGGLVVALALFEMMAQGRLMPSGGNILTSWGIGPLALRDLMFGVSALPQLPAPFWAIVTVISLVGAFLLTRRALTLAIELAADLRHGTHRPVRTGEVFAAVAIGVYLLPLLLIPFYDRYLIPILPLVLYALVSGAAARERRWRWVVPALAMVGLMAVFSVLATHDYMAWNRARWAAIADLERSRQLDHRTIDGGMEYNCLRGYRPDFASSDGVDWWCSDHDRAGYVIAFGPVAGMTEIAHRDYTTFLPPGLRSIYVLSKPD